MATRPTNVPIIEPDELVPYRNVQGYDYATFHNPYPQYRPKVMPEAFDTAAAAAEAGVAHCQQFQRSNPYSNMANLLAVVHQDDGYHAVYNTYVSNT